MDQLEAIIEFASFKLLVHGALFGFLGRGNPQDQEDEYVVKGHEIALDALSDADRTNKVEALTDKNWRDQLTIEQAEQLAREAEEARRGWFRN